MRAALLIAIVGSLAAVNFHVGIGEDPDAFLVVRQAHAWLTDGYAPSRTWGFPLYELIAYPLIARGGGASAAKAWSCVCAAAASVVFLAVLDRITADRRRALAGAIALAVLPVGIIASTTILETALSALLAIVALWAWPRWQDAKESTTARVVWWYVFAGALGCAIGTRIDYVLFAAAFACAAPPSMRRAAWPPLRHAIGGVATVAACALLPYVALYGQFLFSFAIVPADPLPRRFARALFGVAALIGLPAIAYVVGWIVVHMRARAARRGNSTDTLPVTSPVTLPVASASSPHGSLFVLAAVAAIFYFIRFVGLPDELDYIYILAPLLILVVVASRMSTRGVVLFAALVALPNVVQIHLFERTPTGTIAIAPGISPGTIAQERAARRRTEYMARELPAVLAIAATRFGLGPHEYTTDISPGDVRPAIIPEDALRFYRADRRGGVLHASAARARLIVYPLATGRGWRQFLKPDAWRPVTPEDFREVDLRSLPR